MSVSSSRRRWLICSIFVAALFLTSGCKKEEQCRDLMACSLQGRCTNHGEQCIASSDAECKQSSACKKTGLCFAVDGRCQLLRRRR
jgi:hypothetical protein